MPEAWPPDYHRHRIWRMKKLEQWREHPLDKSIAWNGYKTDPAQWISDWVDTFDPRNAFVPGMETVMPLILFQRQREMVQFLWSCLQTPTSGLIEKSRDIGATWVCASFSVWLWLFVPGASVGWGSRKAMFVDHIGNIDSIFEKMRRIVTGLPPEFLPDNYEMGYMKMINYDSGASITGEAGDEIGRGGRKLIYFKDESAHYEHPESIEAALSQNTNVQMDISSVTGLGTVFHRRREGGDDWEPGDDMEVGRTQVFVFDWQDHPGKNQAWYDRAKAKALDEGLLHIFKQEVDRDYAASQVNTILRREWIDAAIDAHKRIPGMSVGRYVSGLDVADGGGDRNALVRRKGSVLEFVDVWPERDTGATARRAVDACRKFLPHDLMYDCVGVGAGVKAETNRLKDDKLVPRELRIHPWDAGREANDPDGRVIPGDTNSPMNKDHYANLKGQGWGMLRRRFERTFNAIKEGKKYKPEDLISIPSDLPRLQELIKELLQPQSKLSSNMRYMVDKQPEGTRSPNMADALMMCYHPVKELAFDTSYDWVG